MRLGGDGVNLGCHLDFDLGQEEWGARMQQLTMMDRREMNENCENCVALFAWGSLHTVVLQLANSLSRLWKDGQSQRTKPDN